MESKELQRSPKQQIARSGSTDALNYTQRIIVASGSQAISALQGLIQVKKALLQILFLLEIPKDRYPDEVEMTALATYISEKHGKTSIPSLLLAFELYITRKLDESPDKFERLGPLTIERVMQSYARYSFNILKEKTTSELPEPDDLAALRRQTDEQREAAMKQMCLVEFERFKRSGQVYDFGNILWKYLEQKGIVNFTEERKQQMKDRVMKNKEIIREFKIKDGICPDMDAEAKIECRLFDLYLRTFFNDMLESDTTPEELFEQ